MPSRRLSPSGARWSKKRRAGPLLPSSSPPRRGSGGMFRRSALRASACATAAFAAVGSARSDASHADSPFTYPALERAIRERRARERKLATYVATVSPMIASARAEVDAAARNAARDPAALERARLRFARLADRVRAETSALTWGRADAERERDAFVRRYGCVGWTDGALDVIAEHAPIVEIGAGRGLGSASSSAAASTSSPTTTNPRSRATPTRTISRLRRPRRRLLRLGGECGSGTNPRSARGACAARIEPCSSCTRRGTFCPGACGRTGARWCCSWGRGGGGVNGDARAFDELEREWEVRRIRRRQTLRGRPREALGAREEEEATGDELWSSLTEEEMCSSL